ncbi:flagellar type III secretion system pore protein FliP [Pelagibaculum spongiae]|uniref:Flagellar biosynthetic protein FliP n=1 Tax=Pelagibaculum spongiae TaxID=2080658 RepID=A0A2V1GRW3_9GAMM|nr:flagellar type III secretion system pore protein FliP [Pelagibaculum spongiae]PVZ66714.1 flagellar biosynthetic protein FliP [Pelagibaculum spongiae]
MTRKIIGFLILMFPVIALAEPGIPAVSVTAGANGGQEFTVSLQVLAIMTGLTLLPSLVMMTTAFTRIVIVLGLLRQAMGMPTVPSNQVILGLSLFLSFFVMYPVLERANQEALQPYMAEEITSMQALEKAKRPFAEFMIEQTRVADIDMFIRMDGGDKMPDTLDEVPFHVLVPAFVISELKTAFQIGFLLFLPFLVIDLVVASVLMAMGMMMLSPMVISLPFKIMLFVMVDGWTMIIGTLMTSFGVGSGVLS